MPAGRDPPKTDESSTATSEASPGRGGRRLRSLAQIGRRVVREALTEDPDLVDRLAKMGLVDPDALRGDDADPFANAPKKVVARALQTAAASSQQALARAGIGGLEALTAVVDHSPDPEAKPVPENVCVGFTDIEGFTDFTDTHGDEAALDLLRRHAALVEPIVAYHGGRVLKRIGDGDMLAFPTADAGILSILDCFDALDADRARDDGPAIRIRSALTCGRPIAVGDDLVGSDVNLAARLTDLASHGELLVNDAVLGAAGDDLTGVGFEDLGRHAVRGFDEPVRIWRVDRVSHT